MTLSKQMSSAATLAAYVAAVRAQGFDVLEYEHVSPVHTHDSWHYYHLAGDVNWPGGGSEEFAKVRDIAFPMAKDYGLSTICGLYGYEPGHSGANFHLHVDVGAWSRLGNGGFFTPWAGKDTHLSGGAPGGGDPDIPGGDTSIPPTGGEPTAPPVNLEEQTITTTRAELMTIFMPTDGAA